MQLFRLRPWPKTLQVLRERLSKKLSTDTVVTGVYPERKTFAECLSEESNLSRKRKDCSMRYTIFLSLWCARRRDRLRVDIKSILILWSLAAYWIIYTMSFTYYIWVWQFQI